MLSIFFSGRQFQGDAGQFFFGVDVKFFCQGGRDVHGAGRVLAVLWLPGAPEDKGDAAVVVVWRAVLCGVVFWWPANLDERIECEEDVA